MFGKENEKRVRNLCIAGVAVVVLILIFVFAGMCVYFHNRWGLHTKLNELDVSGMTYKQTEKMLQDNASGYCINIIGRQDGKLQIDSKSIDLYIDFDKGLKDAFQKAQDKGLFAKLGRQSYQEEFSVSFSKNKLEEILQSASLVKGDASYSIEKPQNAYVTYDAEKGAGVIVPEKQGNKIITDSLLEVITDAIEHMESEIDLTEDEIADRVYQKPKFYSTDQTLQDEWLQYNTYLLNWITWKCEEGIEETMTPEDIKEWLSVSKKGKVRLDKAAMSQWVEAFCLKYKTQGKTRTFTTHDNREIQVEGGDYGWRINYEATVKQAYKTIQKAKDVAKIEAYINDPSEENQESLSTSLEIKFSNKGYVLNLEHPTQDWNTQNYSEVDLTDQMVYVYKNGKLAHSAICVTGLPSDPERSTRTGCYYIKERREEYLLVGADYQTPTKYWVRIMWTGTGYHYLGRSDWGSWSPETYLTRGSHGCINLQLEDAKAVYDLVSYRDPVFIHK